MITADRVDTVQQTLRELGIPVLNKPLKARQAAGHGSADAQGVIRLNAFGVRRLLLWWYLADTTLAIALIPCLANGRPRPAQEAARVPYLTG